MSDPIGPLLERAMADVLLPPDLAEAAQRGFYRHRRRRRIGRTLGAAAVSGIAGVVIWTVGVGADNAGIATVVPASPAPAKVRNASVACAGGPVTAQKLSEPGGAERGTSPSSQILRNFLQHNPFEGMGTVPNTNWLLLSDTPTEVVFGHREGAVGVGQVVHMQLQNGRVVSENVDGCSTVLVEKGRGSSVVRGATAIGSSLKLQWPNGLCNGVLDEREVRVEVQETKTAVHVLIVTERNPASPMGQVRNGQLVGCAGVGSTSSTTVKLAAPLGNRMLFDDATLNPTRVQPSR